MIVVTSPMGDRKPQALAISIIIQVVNKRFFHLKKNLLNVAITSVTTTSAKNADKKNVSMAINQ